MKESETSQIIKHDHSNKEAKNYSSVTPFEGEKASVAGTDDTRKLSVKQFQTTGYQDTSRAPNKQEDLSSFFVMRLVYFMLPEEQIAANKKQIETYLSKIEESRKIAK